MTFCHDPRRARTRTERRRFVHGGEPSSNTNGLTVNQQVEASRIIREARHIRNEGCKLRHVCRSQYDGNFTYRELERNEKISDSEISSGGTLPTSRGRTGQVPVFTSVLAISTICRRWPGLA